jgi:S-adenosylmethionine hydrolase
MNNPPAFPLHNHGAQTLGLHVTGMTLRDYFAAKSMQAMETRSASGTYHGRAIQAYAQADAMLKAREE